MKRSKFSLIEILVVVAIIGILASFLMPTLKKARESARRASCMNNEKQLGIAFAMYHDDNDSAYPIYDNGSGDYSNISWDDLIGDYDGRKLTQEEKDRDNFRDSDDTYNNDLYLCPSNRQVRSPAILKSYELNNDYYNNTANPSRNVQGIAGMTGPSGSRVGWSTKTSDMSNTSQAIVLTEFHSFNSILGLGTSGIRGGIMSKDYGANGLTGAHASQVGGVSGFYVHDDKAYKMNFLMADGSVAYLSMPVTLGEQRNAFYSGSHIGSPDLQGSYWDTLQ